MKSAVVLLMLLSFCATSQVDFDSFRVFTIGAGIMQTKHQGFYSTQKIRTGNFNIESIPVVRPIEKASIINPELKAYAGNDMQCGQATFAGVFQMLGLLLDSKNMRLERLSGGKFQKIMSSSTKGIEADNFPTNVANDKRFWCIDFIDITFTAGHSKLKYGFDMGWKAIGFSFPGTSLNNSSNTLLYRFEDTHEDNLLRFKLGPAISFQSNIAKHLSLLSFAGCNYLPNVFSSGQYKRKLLNPFFNAAFFIGKDRGLALTFTYNYLLGKNKHMVISNGPQTSSSGAVELVNSYGDVALKITQFETKLCIYINKD